MVLEDASVTGARVGASVSDGVEASVGAAVDAGKVKPLELVGTDKAVVTVGVATTVVEGKIVVTEAGVVDTLTDDTDTAVGSARPANVNVAPEISTAAVVIAAFCNFKALAFSMNFSSSLQLL